MSRCIDLETINLVEVYDYYPFDGWFTQFGYCRSLKDIQINTYCCNCELDFNKLSNCSNLETFSLKRYNGTYANGVSSIKNLDKADKLTTINFTGIVITNTDFSLPKSCVSATFISCKLQDVPIIDSTVTALKTLNLYDCRITSLRRLEGIYCIEELDLRNNLLEDTYSYSIDGAIKTVKTYQTLLDLKNNGSLRKLNVKNENITDYSLLKVSGWNDTNKSGW